MYDYKPARVVLSQATPAPGAAAPTGPAAAPAAPAPVAAPVPAPTIIAYQGVPGLLEVVSVLAITGAAAWIGIDSALHTKKTTKRVASWVGGVGSGLLGLLYLGARSGVGQKVGLPSVTVAPAA